MRFPSWRQDASDNLANRPDTAIAGRPRTEPPESTLSGRSMLHKHCSAMLWVNRYRPSSLGTAALNANESVPTRIRLAAQIASRLNQLRETNLSPR
jgi:hypothetical protein